MAARKARQGQSKARVWLIEYRWKDRTYGRWHKNVATKAGLTIDDAITKLFDDLGGHVFEVLKAEVM